MIGKVPEDLKVKLDRIRGGIYTFADDDAVCFCDTLAQRYMQLFDEWYQYEQKDLSD